MKVQTVFYMTLAFPSGSEKRALLYLFTHKAAWRSRSPHCKRLAGVEIRGARLVTMERMLEKRNHTKSVDRQRQWTRYLVTADQWRAFAALGIEKTIEVPYVDVHGRNVVNRPRNK